MKNNNKATKHPAKGNADKVWVGILAAGVIVAGGAVYLSYYCQVEKYSETSWLVITAGMGLIIGFCLLTVTLIAGIKAFIICRFRFRPVLTIVISGLALIGLIGITIIGLTL